MAVFSTIGSIMAGKSQQKAADKAADTSIKATEMTIDFQREVLDQAREDTRPWREVGAEQIKTLGEMVDAGEFDLSRFDYQKEPGYEFGLEEGMRALDHSAAARGNLLSGAQIKRGVRFATDYASTKYQDAFNRNALAKQTDFNQRAGIAGAGQTAVSQATNAGSQFATQTGNALMQNASNVANAQMTAGNAKANMYSNIGNNLAETAGTMAGFFF